MGSDVKLHAYIFFLWCNHNYASIKVSKKVYKHREKLWMLEL